MFCKTAWQRLSHILTVTQQTAVSENNGAQYWHTPLLIAKTEEGNSLYCENWEERNSPYCENWEEWNSHNCGNWEEGNSPN